MSKNSDLQTLSSALADAVQTAGASLVTVDARPRLAASGVMYAAGKVLTASHVVYEDEISVTLPDGKELKAELLGRDMQSDLAVLKLAEALGSPAEKNDDPKVGQLALALGRPNNEGVQASLGIVSVVGGPVHLRRGNMLESYIRTDAVPYPGFSGGPLVDVEGRVLGINTSGIGLGASLTIPAKLAWQLAATIEEFGGVKRGYLGVRSQLVEISEENSKALKRQQATGLLIMGIEKDSPAANGGLIVGDIIVGFASHSVSDHDELLLQLNSGVVGKPSQIEILRGGQPQAVKVTIGEVQETYEDHSRHGHTRRGFSGHGRPGWRWGR